MGSNVNTIYKGEIKMIQIDEKELNKTIDELCLRLDKAREDNNLELEKQISEALINAVESLKRDIYQIKIH